MAQGQGPNDRVPTAAPSGGAPAGDVPDPKVFFVVDGKQFGRPSLETYYAKTEGRRDGAPVSACSCNTVAGSYCSCNKVCSCVPVH